MENSSNQHIHHFGFDVFEEIEVYRKLARIQYKHNDDTQFK